MLNRNSSLSTYWRLRWVMACGSAAVFLLAASLKAKECRCLQLIVMWRQIYFQKVWWLPSTWLGIPINIILHTVFEVKELPSGGYIYAYQDVNRWDSYDLWRAFCLNLDDVGPWILTVSHLCQAWIYVCKLVQAHLSTAALLWCQWAWPIGCWLPYSNANYCCESCCFMYNNLSKNQCIQCRTHFPLAFPSCHFDSLQKQAAQWAQHFTKRLYTNLCRARHPHAIFACAC